MQHLVGHLGGHRATAAVVLAADAGGGDERLAELALGHLLGRVAVDDVADLVAEHAGELGLVLELVEERAGDEDLPAGQGERVDRLRSSSR